MTGFVDGKLICKIYVNKARRAVIITSRYKIDIGHVRILILFAGRRAQIPSEIYQSITTKVHR